MPFNKPVPFSDQLSLLQPSRNMGRNEKCWCDSGVKWKKCHAIREFEKALPVAAHLHELRKQLEFEICLHPDAPNECSSAIARAHTIQRNGGLSEIAEDGHVLSGRDSSPSNSLANEESDLSLVGVRSTSTFRGFCAKHDGQTFRPADIATEISSEVAFLLAYRALAYEVYMKMIALPVMEKTKNLIDRGMNFENQANVQQEYYVAIQGFRAGLTEHEAHMATHNDFFKEGNFEKYNFKLWEIEGDFPIVTSGTFFPEYSFDGEILQDLNRQIGYLSLLAFNIIYINNRCFLVFGWISDTRSSNTKFTDSLSNFADDDVGDILIRFCFETSDNIFVRPSWWGGRTAFQRNELLDRLRQNIPGSHTSDGLMLGGLRYLDQKLPARRLK